MSTMSNQERTQLIVAMGESIGAIEQAIQQSDASTASSAFIKFMGAAGYLAQEIDELNNANAN